MRDSARQWLAFAEENCVCAHLVAENGYLNSALQNAQQAVEKALKALIVEKGLGFRKTHSVQELRDILSVGAVDTGLTDEHCELLDSIYLPSKYPLGSALPNSDPDRDTCDMCIMIADGVVSRIRRMLGG